MKKTKINISTELTLKNIDAFIKRRVTKFGTGAKVDCPKEYLGNEVYLVIVNKEK
ncbi:DUF2080 family transposase-associated protein [Candidatus Woesearchaeota archaeon]|nr:DUF2080 family transposase-associated protein [Candidatus Woesearchaeota archaeon]